jgi:predicted dehydrogenase/aryl-alcohol dehydrogenase-like predicted oxidoreductase
MSKRLQWGIIGTGLIAKELADGVHASTTGELLAVGSRSQHTADEFGEAYGIPKRYDSYQKLLDDPHVQAIYVAIPHPFHAEWAIKAAEAGKHILVEKPIGMNWFEAMAMIDAARVHDVFLMEAFMYRCHPQIARLVDLIREGKVGEVRMLHSAFAYNSSAPLTTRTFANELGGGGILDVGCYPVSAARLVAGAAIGKPFDEPVEVKASGTFGPTGVDAWSAATLRFPSGIIAQVATAVSCGMGVDNVISVYGADGSITVPDPWIPSRWNRDPSKIIIRRGDKPDEVIVVENKNDLYTLEADAVATNIGHRQAPQMTWNDSLGNIRVLDAWRREVGLVYESEKPTNVVHTITRRPLAVRANAPMQYYRLAGLDKPISRLIIGADSNNTMPDTAINFDAFFELGGTTFDTSHGYGLPGWKCERNLGQWIRNRGIRDKVVVIEKGANAPNDNPDGLTLELVAGLENLQMDQVDLYMIHRDNMAIPIGEWVDVLNQNLRSGRMKAFGLSNFSIARLNAFRDYAAKHNLTSYSMVSNQFSLARMIQPIWNCSLVSSSDVESRAWFEETQTPLFPWSSQARGFFTDRAGRGIFSNAEVVRCWYSEENFRRRDRAVELARKKGVELINIALAYVLCQPFPTCPLVGPKQHSEIRSTMRSLDIKLSQEELDWLDSGESSTT